MVSNLETVLTKVLKKVNPSEKEEKNILQLADSLVEKVKTAAKKAGVKARVRVEGSVAKNTWIKGEPDIDIFMQVPLSTPREAFGTTCLNIAKEAIKGSVQVERFAEHPYLEAIVNGIRVNIVPCYKAKLGEWVSATDRTPFHTDYVMPRLDERLRNEIRLLKRFMKGVGVYGAEIKVGGFSGYLCELLVLRYNSFVGVLKAAADLRETWLIDYEGYYKGRENELPKIFEEPLIMVDPVDKGRNVASAVRKARLIEFIAASRKFLKKPRLEFFYPRETRAFNTKKLIDEMKKRGATLVFVKFDQVKTVPDILWGQLYKTQRSLRRMFTQNDFRVVNDAVWSDEKALNILLFEVENRFLPPSRKHIGPPIEKRVECERFLRKHLGASATISGPRLEDGRWVVDIKRKHTDIVELLREKLKHGGRQIGVAEMISKALANSTEILVNEEIMKTYLSNNDFARFLTECVQGKPKWL
jgi:tRNA nucleotidyltransferase (CCA-adding enzyme)